MCLVYFSLLRVVVVFKRKLLILREAEQRKQDRLTETGHALHPCHSLLCLYHLCDSDELWMRL